VGGTNTTYLYDANGNLTKKDDGTNVHAYGYDFRNLMSDYDGPGANNDATYKYGASGLRVQKSVAGSTTTKYYQDGLNTVAEYNGSNQLQRAYVTPGLDQNLSLTASGSTYYYLSDALGSIRQVLDSDESTQNSYDYEAFGSVHGSPTENIAQPFRFTGREWDPESSLHYYRARTYAASLGRFLARDPLVLRPAYAYVLNRPTILTDPSGLDVYFVVDTNLWPGHVAVVVDVYGANGNVIGHVKYDYQPTTHGWNEWTMSTPWGPLSIGLYAKPSGVEAGFQVDRAYRSPFPLRGLRLGMEETQAFQKWADNLASNPPGYGWVIPWLSECANWFQNGPGLRDKYFSPDPGLWPFEGIPARDSEPNPHSPKDFDRWLDQHSNTTLEPETKPLPPKAVPNL
jgi:RHS repeat-associated protein